MIKFDIVKKYVTVQKAVIKEKLGFGLRAMQKSLSKDVFDSSNVLEVKNPVANSIANPITKPAVKTFADLKKILEQPEMKERAVELNPYIGYLEQNLKNRAMIQPFAKVLTAKNSTLTTRDIMMISGCIRPENAKYVDVLVGAVSSSKTIDWKSFGESGYSDVFVNISKIKEQKLIEILSDKKTKFPEKLKLIVEEEKILGLNSLKNPKMRQTAEKITDRVSCFSCFYESFSNIEEKMKNVKDSKIKSHITKELLALEKIQEGPEITFKLQSMESLLDAYHVAKKHYSSISGDVGNFYASISSLNPEAISKSGSRGLNMKDKSTSMSRMKLKAQSNLKDFLLVGTHAETKVARRKAGGFLVANLKKESKLEALKQYIIENKEPEMADYMYKKYYVSSLHPKAKAEHLKILNDFGTKLFYVKNNKAPGMVYDELARWKKAGGSEFVPPNTLNLSKVDSSIIENGYSGFFRKKSNSIEVISDGSLYLRHLLRHEIMHGNDMLLHTDDRGVVNGIDFAAIKKNREYSKEFANAGIEAIEGAGCNYAYKNKAEFVAVAAEGDFSRYSENFKQVLVKLGMPKWVFNIELANPEVKRAAEHIAKSKASGS